MGSSGSTTSAGPPHRLQTLGFGRSADALQSGLSASVQGGDDGRGHLGGRRGAAQVARPRLRGRQHPLHDGHRRTPVIIGADRQLGLPDHNPHPARPRGLGPGWQDLPRTHTRLSERVEFRRQLFEARLGWDRPAHGVPRRGPVDHHVTRARDRGRAVPDRRTLLADLASKRTYAT